MEDKQLELIPRLSQEVLERVNGKRTWKPRKKYNQQLPSRYRSYLARANKKSISFTLTVNEFEMICSKECVYCGRGSKVGIDRIDSGGGYDLENCQPCCSTCNMMKFTMDHHSFLQHIKRIYSHSSQSRY